MIAENASISCGYLCSVEVYFVKALKQAFNISLKVFMEDILNVLGIIEAGHIQVCINYIFF